MVNEYNFKGEFVGGGRENEKGTFVTVKIGPCQQEQEDI